MQQIMEIWATVGLSNQVNRFHATFFTDVDDETIEALGASCPLPLPLTARTVQDPVPKGPPPAGE